MSAEMNSSTTEDYIYDITESFSSYNWNEYVPTLIVYGSTFILGLSGNILIVYTTYRYRRMQNVTNVFLASLATADLLLILVCIPVKIAKLFSYSWEMGELLCKCIHYVQNVSAICSVLTLTAISLERYYAIVHPMKAKYICTISQAKKVIGVTWISSLLFATPILFVQVHMEVGGRVKAFWCVKDIDNKDMWLLYEVYMLFIILIVPISIMSFAYTLICWEVWRVMERRSLMTSGNGMSTETRYEETNIDSGLIASIPDPTRKNRKKACEYRNGGSNIESINLTDISDPLRKAKKSKNDTKTMKQVIYMLVSVVVLFAICWSPILIYDLLSAYGLYPAIKGGFQKHLYTTFHLMAYFNSCINPIVYGFMSKNFRESFLSVLCCKSLNSRQQRTASRMTSSIRHMSSIGSQTRSTSLR